MTGDGMNDAPRAWRFQGGELPLGKRTLIMGVVNVTPDSFSDGGRFLEAGAGVEQGLRLLDEGADMLDIGGESTRPGAEPLPTSQELARVLPVIRGVLDQAPEALISIDTYKAPVAREAVAAGARVINDVTALAGDADMAHAAAELEAGLVLMHMQGEPSTMQKNPTYQNVVEEVAAFLGERSRQAQAAGVAAQAVMVDPGIGFGKSLGHNLALIRNLARLGGLGHPVLLGASNKSMLGMLSGRPLGQRLHATLGAHVAAALLGADMVRVHEVAPVKDALAVADAVFRENCHHG